MLIIWKKHFMVVRDRSRTAFSATALGELAISIPMRPIGLFDVESSPATPTSCMKLAVASLLRSCMTKVSLAGIFARRFLAIGYPEKGTQPFVSTIHSPIGAYCQGHGGASTRGR